MNDEMTPNPLFEYALSLFRPSIIGHYTAKLGPINVDEAKRLDAIHTLEQVYGLMDGIVEANTWTELLDGAKC